MTQQTLGQRIAAERKKLGLSQEALGEKMGVSRQAISKWESDAAVPEIDKLIAMSKLFGVSLGWLLGVEEEKPRQSPSLSDEQLRMIEQIVRKYTQPPAPRRSPILTALAAGTLVLSLLLSALALAKASDTSAVDSLQSQMAHLNTNYSNLQNDIFYLSSQLNQMAQGEQLLMEYDFSAVALEDLSGAAVTFTAMPNTRQDGDVGTLSVRQGGSEVVRADCAWDGTAYTATVPVPTADDYEYYFIQSHDTGGQEQQKLEPENHYVTHIAEGMTFLHHIFLVTMDECTTTMQFFTYDAYLYAPPLADPEGLNWEQADLVILQNGKELHRSSILSAVEYSGEEREPNVSMSLPAQPVIVGGAEIEIEIEKNYVDLWLAPDLKPGDTLEARLELRLSNGMALEEVLETWPIS